MKILKNLVLSAAVAVLAVACGGGGGSPGETHAPYQITLRAERTQLPININNVGPGIGAYAPYTTVLYVNATDGGNAIPNGEDGVFSCNASGGLSSGPLYYLDGKDEHSTDVTQPDGSVVKVPNAYRSITLPSNAGGASFHFHAGDKSGVATITCSVTDPRDKRQVSASVSITVGAATRSPARADAFTQVPGYLGTRNNPNHIASTVAIQARVWDDANQPVPDPGAANVQVRIKPVGNPAEVGATLLQGGAGGSSVIQFPTLNGIAQFSLASGSNNGPIILEVTSDRADNNVANGIQDPVTSLMQVYAVNELATVPLVIAETDLGTANTGVEYVRSLVASGGMPPYTWVVAGLPSGLTADDTGVVSGTVDAPPGNYAVRIKVTDANGATQEASAKIVVERGIAPEDFVVAGCPASQDINTACAIGSVAQGKKFSYAFTASVPGVTWSFSGLPAWLSGSSSGAVGIVSGTAPADAVPLVPPSVVGPYSFFVTATSGSTSVTRQVVVTVN